MAPEESAIPADAALDDNDEGLRKRLLSRIAVAGIAIVGLLGGLAVYDSLNKPQAPAMPKMAAAPAEPEPAENRADAEPKQAAIGKDGSAEVASEEKPEEAKVTSAEAVPERSETLMAPPPVAKPLTRPATARPAGIRSGEGIPKSDRPDAGKEIARAAPAVPEDSRPALSAAERPLARAVESARRFLIQVGVFSNHANAEELLQKLNAAGIPARIESRVQVGPFATRAEADAARPKLKSMGIDDGLLVRR